MANTKVQYVGDGATRDFAIPFPYIDRAHVQLLINDVVMNTPSDYVFTSAANLQATVAPIVDAVVEVRRVTPIDTKFVNFQNGAILTEQEMDLDSEQAFYLLQENQENYSDLINDALVALATANGLVVTEPSEVLAQLVQDMINSAAAAVISARITDIDTNAEAILSNANAIVNENLGRVADLLQVESDALAGRDALQSQINALVAATVATVYVQPLPPVPGVAGIPDPIPVGARWYDSDDSNHPYLWDDIGLVWQDLEDPRIGQNAADITALDVRLTTAEGGVSTNATAIGVLDTTVTNINGVVTANASDITQLQVDLAATDATVLAQGNAATALTTRVTTAEGNIGVNSTAITSLNAALVITDGNVAANGGAISALDTRVTSAEGTITSQSASIVSLQSQITANDGELAADALAISGLQTSVTTAEGNISSNASAITALDGRLTTAEGSVTANGLAITALDVRVVAAEGTITSHSSTLTSLQNQITANDGDISGNSGAITALDSRVTTAEGNITSSASDITSLQSEILLRNRTFSQALAPTASNVGDIWFDTDDGQLYRWDGLVWQPISDADIAANASAISALDVRTTAAEGSITSNASDITALDVRIGTAEGTIITQGSAISGLDTRVTTAEGTITSQGSAITTLQNTIDLRSRTFYQALAPTADNIGDLWIDTDDDSLHRWNGTTWDAIQDAAIGANASATTALDTRVTAAEGTLVSEAALIDTLQSEMTTVQGDVNTAEVTIAAHTSAISTAESDIVALEARYGVSLNVNGYISGFSLNNSGIVSDFVIMADKFAIVDPTGDPGETEFIPFSVSNGVVSMQNVEISGSLVVDGTVSAGAFANLVGGLADIDTNMGAITTGTITLDATSHIKGGQTAYATGTGFYLGYSGAAYKFSIGNATDFLTWDGTKLKVRGDLSLGNYTSSTTVTLLAANTERSTTQITPWVTVKRFAVNKPGTVRVYFDKAVNSTVGGIVTASSWRILRDGVQQGSDYTYFNTGWNTTQVDITTLETTEEISIQYKSGERDPIEPLACGAKIRNAQIRATIDLGEAVLQD